MELHHRHLRNIDCLTACSAYLVCFISTVNGCSKKKKEKKPVMSGARSWHTTKLKQSILLRCLWIACIRYGATGFHRSGYSPNWQFPEPAVPRTPFISALSPNGSFTESTGFHLLLLFPELTKNDYFIVLFMSFSNLASDLLYLF